MSYPILYDKMATDFFNLGLGVLRDAISCIVTEERNGVFELEMEYPLTGALFDLLENDRIIKCDAGHALKDQLFRIKKITKKSDGIVSIYAQHVSYLTQDLALRPEVNFNGNGQGALSQWAGSIIDPHPFEIVSDIMTQNQTRLSIKDCQNARQALGGVQGSILDVWGGEYRFDNYRISLLANRGGNANTLIAYGRNLTDLQQEENIASTYTSLYPYAIYTPRSEDGAQGKEELITIDGFIVDSEHVGAYPNRRVLPIDFSDEFGDEERPTPSRLRSLAEQYITANNIGVPRVSLDVSFVDLTKSLNDTGSQYEELNLCDTVPIHFEKLNIQTRAKIIRIEWNVLLDQYEKLEIGEPKASLSDKIREIETGIKEVENDANHALISANGRNTIFYGPEEPRANRVGDLWYKPNGEHTELYMWNGSVWEFVSSTAPNQALLDAIEHVQKEVEQVTVDIEKMGDDIATSLVNSEQAMQNIYQVNTYLDTLQIDLTQNKNDVKLALEQAGEALTGEIHGDRIIANTIIGDKIQANTLTSSHLQANSITSDKIASHAIMTSHLRVGDFTNLCRINEITDPNGYTVITHTDNNRYFKVGSTTVVGYHQIQFTEIRTPSFSVGDEFLFRYIGYRDATIMGMVFVIRYIYRDAIDGRNWVNAGTVSISPPIGSAGEVSATCRITNAIDSDRTLEFVRVFMENSDTAGYYYVRNIGIFRRNNGQMIVDGTIQANHIVSNAITTDKLAANAVTTANIEAGAITAEKIQSGTLTSASGVFGDISASTITSGTLDASNVSIINLNANNITTGRLDGISVRTWNSSTASETVLNDGQLSVNYGNSSLRQQGQAWLNPEGLVFRPTRIDGSTVSNVEVLYRPEGMYRRSVGGNFTHYINMRSNDAIRFYGDCMFNNGANMNNQPIRNVQRMGILTTGVDGGIWFPGGSQGWKITEMNNNMVAQAGNLHIVNRGRKRITFVDDVTRMLLWRNQSDQNQTRQDAIAHDGNAILVHGGNNWSSLRIGVMANGRINVTTNTSNEVFRPVRASAFEVRSTIKSKGNIKSVSSDQALDLINSLKVKTFNYKTAEPAHISYMSRTFSTPDDYEPEICTGVISEESPAEIVCEDGESVNTTNVLFYNVSATQALYTEIEKLKAEIKTLKGDG